MPSSQKSLTAKLAARDLLLAEKDAELVAQAAEILTLRMELDSREAVISYQNGAMDEMGRLIEQMPGGLVAKLSFILERHGVKISRSESSPWQ